MTGDSGDDERGRPMPEINASTLDQQAPDGSGLDEGHRRTGEVGDRVVTGAAMLFGTGLLVRVLQFATTLVLARLLTPADYGVVVLAIAVSGFLDVMSDLQVGGAIVQARTIDRSLLDTAFTIGLLRAVLVGSLLLGSAHFVASVIHQPRLAPVLEVLAIGSAIGGLKNPFFIMFERNLDFSRESTRAALSTVAGAIIGIVAALIFRSYWALVIANLSRTAMDTAFSWFRVPGRPHLSLARLREIFSFAGWISLAGIVDYANSRADTFLLGRQLGNATLGAYSLGQQINMMATGDIVGPLSRAIFPAFSMVAGDPDRLRAGYRRAQEVMMGLALPIGVGTSLLAPELVRTLTGPQWTQAVPVVRVLAPVIALQTLAAATDSVAYATGRTSLLFRRVVILFVIRVSLLVIGFLLGGFMGIIYARVVSGACYLSYNLSLAARLTASRFMAPFAASWRSLGAAAFMSAVLLLLRPQAAFDHAQWGPVPGLVLAIAIGGLCYVGAHAFLWMVAGRPDGFEVVLLQQAGRARKRLLRTSKAF